MEISGIIKERLRDLDSGLEAYALAKELELVSDLVKKEWRTKAIGEWTDLDVQVHTGDTAIFRARKPSAIKEYPERILVMERELKAAKEEAEKTGEVKIKPGKPGLGFSVHLKNPPSLEDVL